MEEWNALPPTIRMTRDYKLFKKKIKLRFRDYFLESWVIYYDPDKSVRLVE